jgi:hypothetical protein
MLPPAFVEIELIQESLNRQLACQIDACFYPMAASVTLTRVNVPSKLEKLKNFDKEIRKKFRNC